MAASPLPDVQRPKAAVTSSVSRYSVICFTFPASTRNTRQ
jgi:hypothetical protein